MSEPVVRTFPAYAFGLLRLAATERGEPAPRLLTGSEQDAVIRDMLDAPGRAGRGGRRRCARRSRTRAFAAELRDLLLRAAERGIGARTLAELGRRARPARLGRPRPASSRSTCGCSPCATRRTRGSVAYDQAELVRAAAALLVDDPALLAAERDRCRYVYVDELADTDPAQIDLLGLVAGGGGARGRASPTRTRPRSRSGAATRPAVRDFTERFPTADGRDAPRVMLPVELPVAAGAGRGDPPGRRPPARPGRPPRHRQRRGHRAERRPRRVGPLEVVHPAVGRPASRPTWPHRLREAHLRHGVPWSRMAVIVRSLQHHHAALRRALTQAGVPVTTGAEDTALATQPAVAPLLRSLRCALDESTLDEETAVGAAALAAGRRRPVRRAAAAAGRCASSAPRMGDRRPSGELLVEALRDAGGLALVDAALGAPGPAMAGAHGDRPRGGGPADGHGRGRAVGGLAGQRPRRPVGRGQRAGRAAGGHRRPRPRRGPGALRRGRPVHRPAARAPGSRRSWTTCSTSSCRPTRWRRAADRGEAVRILTAHAAKGLEWDVVAVAGVQEGVWPDLRLRGSVLGSERLVDMAAGRDVHRRAARAPSQVAALLDEERRLFYVAATRARRCTAGHRGRPEHDRQRRRGAAQPVPGRAAGVEPTAGRGRRRPSRRERGERAVRARRAAPPAHAAGAGGRAAHGGRPTRPAGAECGRRPRRSWPGSPRPACPAPTPTSGGACAQLSDARPAGRPAGEPVRVTPSTVESVLRCGLRWLLERHGGSDPPTAKQGIGNLVHAAAMLAEATGEPLDAVALRAYVADRFDQIELPARWLGQRERDRANRMVDKLLSWLSDNPREQLAIEQEFASRLEPRDDGPAVAAARAGRPARARRAGPAGRGRPQDRVPARRAPRTPKVHPQLAAYQVAVEAGRVRAGHGLRRRGDRRPSAQSRQGPAVREQPPLAEAEDPAGPTRWCARRPPRWRRRRSAPW